MNTENLRWKWKQVYNVITKYYIHGAGLMAMVTPAGEVYTYHYNAVGSTIAVTDQSQNIVNKYAYDEFGNIMNQVEAVPQPFKFVGQYGVMTEPNGFYYMRARYYDPRVGRFISEDPIGFEGGDVNLYVYVSNNPVLLVDPNGQCPWCILAIRAGMGAVNGAVSGFTAGAIKGNIKAGIIGGVFGGVAGAAVGIALPGSSSYVGAAIGGAIAGAVGGGVGGAVGAKVAGTSVVKGALIGAGIGAVSGAAGGVMGQAVRSAGVATSTVSGASAQGLAQGSTQNVLKFGANAGLKATGLYGK